MTVDFRIPRGGRRVKNKPTALDIRRADFDLIKDLLERVLWDKALEGRRWAHESWLV